MEREEAKELFRKDKDSFGRVKKPMAKLDLIFDSLEYKDINRAVYILERVDKRNKVISMGYFDSFDKAKKAQSQSNLKTQINVQKIY